MAQRAWAVHPRQWNRPRFDAFGLPIDWVPPSEPSLIGANAGETAVSYYLRSARAAADEATLAVKGAMDQLIGEATDVVALDTARQKARGIDQLKQREFCGDQNPNCTVAFTVKTRTRRPARRVSDRAVPVLRDGEQPDQGGHAVVSLSTEVADILPKPSVAGGGGTAPTWPKYAGGKLQGLLIRQWTSLRALATNMYNVQQTALATADAVAAAQAS